MVNNEKLESITAHANNVFHALRTGLIQYLLLSSLTTYSILFTLIRYIGL